MCQTLEVSIQRCVLFSLFGHSGANTFGLCDSALVKISEGRRHQTSKDIWGRCLCDIIPKLNTPESLTSKGRMDFFLVLSTYNFFRQGQSDRQRYYWPFAVTWKSCTFSPWSSSLNKLLVFRMRLRRNGHICGCGIANTKHEMSTVKKKVRTMGTVRGQKGTEPYSVRNKQGPSGRTRGQEEGRKKTPAFLKCYHGIKQQQKGPLLPRLNLLRVCPREQSVLWLGQIFFSSRYILFFFSFALLRKHQTSADASVSCKCEHVRLH